MKKRTKRTLIVAGVLLFLVLCFGSATCDRKHYMAIYHEGVSYLEAGDYKKAVDTFQEIPNYTSYQDIGDLLIERDICPNCGAVME